MAEGLFDHQEPDHVHIAEMRANWMSVALTERVLERVKNTEGRVSSFLLDAFGQADPFFVFRWRPFVLDWMFMTRLIPIFTQSLGDWKCWLTARRRGFRRWKVSLNGFRPIRLCAHASGPGPWRQFVRDRRRRHPKVLGRRSLCHQPLIQSP